MRSISVIWMLCLALMFLTGCRPKEYIYVEIIINENLPPLFILSADQELETPALVRGIEIFPDEPGKPRIYWALSIGNRAPSGVPIRQVVYGVVPDGINESVKALPLEPNGKYRFEIWGGVAGVGATVHFTYRPGSYSGYGHS